MQGCAFGKADSTKCRIVNNMPCTSLGIDAIYASCVVK
jgi:hypothetical protein